MNLSLTEFAKAIGVGRQTLVRIESGDREPKAHEYKAMADASGLPLEFFTTPDLRGALAGADLAPTLAERVSELERELEAMDDRYDALQSELRAEQLGRASLEAALEELLGADLQRALAEARRR